jgi:hypothetical protein
MAAAAVAGCAVAKPSVDNDTIDWTLSSRLPSRPKLDVQLKCTADDDGRGDDFPFALKRKNYDDLILTDLICPRILVVVVVPEDIEHWLEFRDSELLLRRSAFWMSLAGMPESGNSASVTVQILRKNRFTVKSLTALMEKVDHGEPL